jgi:hypothetical protein
MVKRRRRPSKGRTWTMGRKGSRWWAVPTLRRPEGQALRGEVKEIMAAAGARKRGMVTNGGGSEEKEAEPETAEATAAAAVTTESEFATTLGEQVRILCRRTLISVWRNPASAAMQFGAMFFFIALIGGIYWRMDTGPTGLQNRVGAFFLLVRFGIVVKGRGLTD